MFKFSKNSLDVLKTVDGRLQALTYAVLANSNYDFGIPSTGGLRTAEEQNALYKKKWSQLDGYNKKSYHQTGKAIDIFIITDGLADYKSIDKYRHVAFLFKKYFKLFKSLGIFPENSSITWGGDWRKFKDLPHFQINNA